MSLKRTVRLNDEWSHNISIMLTTSLQGSTERWSESWWHLHPWKHQSPVETWGETAIAFKQLKCNQVTADLISLKLTVTPMALRLAQYSWYHASRLKAVIFPPSPVNVSRMCCPGWVMVRSSFQHWTFPSSSSQHLPLIWIDIEASSVWLTTICICIRFMVMTFGSFWSKYDMIYIDGNGNKNRVNNPWRVWDCPPSSWWPSQS